MDQPIDKPIHPIVKYLIKHQNISNFLFEFIGCAFLVFAALNVGILPPVQDQPELPNPFRLIYVAIIVYFLICFAGPISGAHINPAVSISLYFSQPRQKRNIKTLLLYISAQLLGVTIGILISEGIYNNGGPVLAEIPDIFQLAKQCIEEAIGTFLLVFFIFLVTNQTTTFLQSESWKHLTIGFIYYYCLSFSTKYHLLNPAICFIAQLQGIVLHHTPTDTIIPALLIILAQIIGGVVGMTIFKIYKRVAQNWRDNPVGQQS